MKYAVEVYQGSEPEPVLKIDLLVLVRFALENFFGRRFDQLALRITVVDVPGDAVTPGLPVVRHLQPDFGYCQIKLLYGERVVYQHPHTIEDLIGRPLQLYLREKYPEVAEWSYRIDVPGMPPLTERAARPTPQVAGLMEVRPFEPGEQPGFQIRRLPEAPPPIATLAQFGVAASETQREALVKVVLPESLADDLCRSRPLSDEIEEGGFLIGRIHRDGDCDGCYIAELLGAPNAEHTGASLLQFTFTGDSFAAVKRILREQRPGERILGWFHTHLFPATDEMGLSSIDLTLHFSTFTIPWQLAGLINLDGRQRTLRFYARRGNDMVLCPHWSTHERG